MTDSFPKSQKGWHVVDPTTLGDRFAATLKEWLTPEEFEEMKRRAMVIRPWVGKQD
jgi:hypothetical protein